MGLYRSLGPALCLFSLTLAYLHPDPANALLSATAFVYCGFMGWLERERGTDLEALTKRVLELETRSSNVAMRLGLGG